MSRDRDPDDERPRLSWSEIDKRRDRPRLRGDAERRPSSRAGQEKARAATKQYLRKMEDRLFSGDAGGASGAALAAEIRAAHGSPRLADACRTYLDTVGPPQDVALASCFLDADEPSVIVAGLEALDALQTEGRLSGTPGLRSQLRLLAEHADDDVAYAAEQLLEKL